MLGYVTHETEGIIIIFCAFLRFIYFSSFFAVSEVLVTLENIPDW